MIPTGTDLAGRQHVRCYWGGLGRETRFEGRILAYSTGPMIHVENERGERLWWSASLAERADRPPLPRLKIRRILPGTWGVYCAAHPPIRGSGSLGAMGKMWDEATPKTVAQSHRAAIQAAEQHVRQFHAEVS